MVQYNKGAAFIYNHDGTGITTITGGQFTDYFGSSVGASTSVTLRDGVHSPALVVGAYQDQSQGRVYVYDESGNELVVLDPNPNSFGEYFGWSVAAGSERIVAGSPQDDDNGTDSGSVGVASVYYNNGTSSWEYTLTKIVPSDGAAGDNFGDVVAVGDNKIVVGCKNNRSNRGAVYVYDLDGTNEIKITASNEDVNFNFGSWVAIGSNKIAVGAPGVHGNKGAVYLYDLDGNNEKIIENSDQSVGRYFGARVAINGNQLAVGADTSVYGAVYIYTLEGTKEFKITHDTINERFGEAVEFVGDDLWVGARYTSDPEFYTGKVHKYTRNVVQAGTEAFSAQTPEDTILFNASGEQLRKQLSEKYSLVFLHSLVLQPTNNSLEIHQKRQFSSLQMVMLIQPEQEIRSEQVLHLYLVLLLVEKLQIMVIMEMIEILVHLVSSQSLVPH